MNTEIKPVTLAEALAVIQRNEGGRFALRDVALEHVLAWLKPSSIGPADAALIAPLMHACLDFYPHGVLCLDDEVWQDWRQLTRLMDPALLRDPNLIPTVIREGTKPDWRLFNKDTAEGAMVLLARSNALAWGKEMPLEVAFALSKHIRRVRPSWRMDVVDAILGALPPEPDPLALTKHSWAVAKAFELKAMMTALEQIQNALTPAESVKTQA